MNITQLYNHARMMQEARKGMEIVNATPRGNEAQQYNVGDVVQSTACSTYTFARGVIVEVYNDNGYYLFVVKIGGCTYTARTKDTRRAE